MLLGPLSLRRFSTQVLTVLFVAVGQAACSPARLGTRITVASAGRISSLDPAQANGGSTLQLLSALGDPLYSIDTRKGLQPRLAADLPLISTDGRTVTIPLRQDVLFHDGSRFDAEAMAFSLRRFLSIGTLSYIVGDRISAVEVAGPFRLRLRLSHRAGGGGGARRVDRTHASWQAHSAACVTTIITNQITRISGTHAPSDR